MAKCPPSERHSRSTYSIAPTDPIPEKAPLTGESSSITESTSDLTVEILRFLALRFPVTTSSDLLISTRSIPTTSPTSVRIDISDKFTDSDSELFAKSAIPVMLDTDNPLAAASRVKFFALNSTNPFSVDGEYSNEPLTLSAPLREASRIVAYFDNISAFKPSRSKITFPDTPESSCPEPGQRVSKTTEPVCRSSLSDRINILRVSFSLKNDEVISTPSNLITKSSAKASLNVTWAPLIFRLS